MRPELRGRVISLRAAEVNLDGGFTIPGPAGLGPPDHWLLQRGEDRVVGVWIYEAGSGGEPVEGGEDYELVARVAPPDASQPRFCRSLAWRERPEELEDAIRRVRRFVVPGVSQNEGFQGGIWLADRTSGQCVGFTFWDSAENLEASGAVGRQLRSRAVEHGEMDISYVREYEVLQPA